MTYSIEYDRRDRINFRINPLYREDEFFDELENGYDSEDEIFEEDNVQEHPVNASYEAAVRMLERKLVMKDLAYLFKIFCYYMVVFLVPFQGLCVGILVFGYCVFLRRYFLRVSDSAFADKDSYFGYTYRVHAILATALQLIIFFFKIRDEIICLLKEDPEDETSAIMILFSYLTCYILEIIFSEIAKMLEYIYFALTYIPRPIDFV